MGLGCGWSLDAQGQVEEQSPCRGAVGGSVGGKGQGSDSAAGLPILSALPTILHSWLLDQYLEDSCQPPDLPCQKQLVAFVHGNLPGLDLECHVHVFQNQLQCQL